MEVNLAWRDERLTFYNLRSSAGLPNILDNDILSLLWVPGIYFPSGLFEENLKLETGTMTHTTVTAVPGRNGSLTTLNSYETLEYPGSDVVLHIKMLTLVTTTCSFTLRAYPFDTQMCVIPMKLDGFGTFQIAEEHLRVLSNDLSLPVFEFRPVRCFYNASLSQEVKMGLLLTRRSGAFLLSSIGPCVVLLLLGHLSFVAFPLHQFTDRASTSLSLLIVVAALFSQMSSTMPESAQPKAIDMWFFYCILRFFIFFVFHCIVDHHYKKSIEADKRQKESLASSKQQEALIFFKAPSLDSLKDPCEPPDKGDNDEPCHHGRWVTEGKCSLPSITLPHPWLTPQLVNRMSLFFGVFQDLMFVVGFIIHLNTTNSFTKTQFYTFKDCSERGWR
ncbi:gamma-aminobutyric acid receptor subunit rho-3-like [Portunus trituberculatus]|uniref:gamma-aminobutyric acid receptor subunit rho-3-like n=1 Tax=Portunus trituberculatus TaxID=210409 RepID=UPI001E1D12F7|nr:gamma-aminobutyric acid receptor subunit rho-3-like [Portunus trituberculatus]